MDTIAVFPDLTANTPAVEPTLGSLQPKSSFDAASPPEPENAALSDESNTSQQQPTRVRTRRRVRRRASANRSAVSPSRVMTAPLRSQWAAVTVLAAVAAAVWAAVLVVERQPLPGVPKVAAEPFAAVRVAADPSPSESAVETRRQ